MSLDITTLTNAMAQLELALNYYHSDAAETDRNNKLLYRTAAIQAFEFTYELAVKMLKRYLENTEISSAGVDKLTFNELIRLGYDRGLINAELVVWKSFRDGRNITSHGYDHEKAQVIFEKIPAFLEEAKFLYNQISERQSRNADN